MGAIHEHSRYWLGAARSASAAIDERTLERIERIARGLPGHVVSVGADEANVLGSPDEPAPDSEPVLRIDGVDALEIIERYFER